MIIDRRLLAGVLGSALLVAACGSSSPTASPPAASNGATSSPAQATPAPTEGSATATPEDTTPDVSLAPGSAAELEGMLPSEANGVNFTKASFDGSAIPGGSLLNPSDIDPILTKHGKTVADVRFAVASPADTSGTQTASILAYQIKGVPATEWLADLGVDTASMTAVTISGKQVLQSSVGGFSTVIYTKDDVIFIVLLASDDLAKAILAKLP